MSSQGQGQDRIKTRQVKIRSREKFRSGRGQVKIRSKSCQVQIKVRSRSGQCENQDKIRTNTPQAHILVKSKLCQCLGKVTSRVKSLSGPSQFKVRTRSRSGQDQVNVLYMLRIYFILLKVILYLNI